MTDQQRPSEESLEDLYAEANRLTEDLANTAPDDSSVRAIAEGAARLSTLDRRIQAMEEEVAQLRSERHALATKTLPDLMDEAGTDRIGIPDAMTDLVVTTDYHANISAKWEPEKRDAAFAHLDELGGGPLIKATVTLAFEREDLPHAKALLSRAKEWLTANKISAATSLGMEVNWQRLTSFVRDYEETPRRPGDNRPPLIRETIGASVFRICKLVARRDADSKRQRKRS